VEEIKARVWKPFWTNLIESSYGSRVAKHFDTMRTRAGHKKAFDNHFQQDSEITELRKFVVQHIEGVDAYYVPESAPREKLAEMTTTGFGRLDVQPFPWRWQITFDDSGHIYEGPAGTEALRRLVKQNKSNVVKLRRENRRVLRALASDGVLVRFKYREGRKEEHENTLIDVDLEFTIGRLRIATADGTRYSHGFKVQMEYDDGEGYGSAPGKMGQAVRFKDKKITIGLEDLGVSHLYDVVDRDNLVDDQGSKLSNIIEDGHPVTKDTQRPGQFVEQDVGSLRAALDQFHEKWRTQLQRRREMEEHLFPSSFFFHVYNAPLVNRSSLEQYFASLADVDAPPVSVDAPTPLANLPKDHAEGLRVLYSRMNHLQRHPSSAIWFFFWNDVWERNRDLMHLRSLQRILDPKNPDSLCYTVLKRPALEAKLQQCGVLRWQNVGTATTMTMRKRKRGAFGPEELDELYNAVHQYKEWREMAHTKTAKASSLHAVDFRSEDDKKRHSILDPLLQRQRRRMAAQAGASSALIGTGKVGRRTDNQHVRDSLLALFALTVGAVAVGFMCVMMPEGGHSCSSIGATGSVLLMTLTPLGLLLVGVSVVRWERQKAARIKTTVAKLNGSGIDAPFGGDTTLIAEAQEYLRKGRVFENGREGLWEVHAYRMYHASRIRLDTLPLADVHEDVCFAIDREAACIALVAMAKVESSAARRSGMSASTSTSALEAADTNATVDKYTEARDLYVRLANIWNMLKSNVSVAEEAAHHTSVALHKAMLCALAVNDPWTASDAVKLGLALDETAFQESVQYKRMKQTLELFSNTDVDAFASAITQWEDEWHLSRWMHRMHGAALGAMKTSCVKFIRSARPDEDAQLEACKWVVNLVIAGDQGAGKTSMCVRWMFSSFVPDPTQVTRGRQRFLRTVEMDDGTRVRVHLHDVSTVEEMGKLRDQAHGVFLLYDAQNDAAFAATAPWLQSKQHMFATFTLVGAKADNPDVKQVRSGKVLALANEHALHHVECSAKTGGGVNGAFKAVLERTVRKLESLQSKK
jgi:hypothetical protein